MMFQMQGSEARTTRFGRIVGVEGSGFGRSCCGRDVNRWNRIAENRVCGEAVQYNRQRVKGKKGSKDERENEGVQGG